jgi:hypothetical protein
VKGVKGRENGRGLKAAINCLNWLAQAGGEEEGGGRRGDDCGGARSGGAEEKEGRKEEEGGALTGGAPVSAAAGIKEKSRGRRAVAGKDVGRVGRPG